jgi:hypothetical protein
VARGFFSYSLDRCACTNGGSAVQLWASLCRHVLSD